MPRFDFDALRADKEQFDVTLDGRTIIFPKVAPTDRVLDLRRQALAIPDDDENAQTDFFLHMGEELMSEENFTFLRSRLGVDELFNLIDELCVYYGIHEREAAGEDAEAEGKSETPATVTETPEAPDPADPSESSISSSTSEPSKPTSNVFGLVPTPSSDPASSTGDVSSVG